VNGRGNATIIPRRRRMRLLIKSLTRRHEGDLPQQTMPTYAIDHSLLFISRWQFKFRLSNNLPYFYSRTYICESTFHSVRKIIESSNSFYPRSIKKKIPRNASNFRDRIAFETNELMHSYVQLSIFIGEQTARASTRKSCSTRSRTDGRRPYVSTTT